MATRDTPCPYCGRKFHGAAGRYQHVKTAHPGQKRAHLKPHRDDDESFADRAIEASFAKAMGEATDDDWLLG